MDILRFFSAVCYGDLNVFGHSIFMEILRFFGAVFCEDLKVF